MSSVDAFIQRFHSSETVDGVFQNGCCYYFALCLFMRFIRDNAEIMYDPVANHFGTKIHGRVYDITGDVTEKYKWFSWESCDTQCSKERITRDCIMF